MFHVGASFISLAPTFFKSQSAFILLLLLSKSNPLGWASVWFWHNLQPLHLFCSYHSKKCDLFRRVAFSFGFRSRWSLHPSVIEMLGRSEFALRQGFACGKTLKRSMRCMLSRIARSAFHRIVVSLWTTSRTS